MVIRTHRSERGSNLVAPKNDNFNLKDIKVESALSVIMDCEDSIVSVDTYDKVSTFKNWLGLLDETIQVKISKNQKSFIRKLNNDLEYILPNGQVGRAHV